MPRTNEGQGYQPRSVEIGDEENKVELKERDYVPVYAVGHDLFDKPVLQGGEYLGSISKITADMLISTGRWQHSEYKGKKFKSGEPTKIMTEDVVPAGEITDDDKAYIEKVKLIRSQDLKTASIDGYKCVVEKNPETPYLYQYLLFTTNDLGEEEFVGKLEELVNIGQRDTRNLSNEEIEKLHAEFDAPADPANVLLRGMMDRITISMFKKGLMSPDGKKMTLEFK